MDKRVLVISAIRGLVSEGQRVSDVLAMYEPDSLGISISKEALDGLEQYLASEKKDICAEPENVEEEVYVAGLSRFGEVSKPPPCFVAAWRFGKARGIQITALDMNDRQFTNAYCRNVSGLDVMFSERREKKIARHRFASRTPEEFVVEWDRVVNSSKGFKNLEMERESCIANAICELTQTCKKLAAMIEFERAAGIIKILKEKNVPFTLVSNK